jgi:hypothetical protein
VEGEHEASSGSERRATAEKLKDRRTCALKTTRLSGVGCYRPKSPGTEQRQQTGAEERRKDVCREKSVFSSFRRSFSEEAEQRMLRQGGPFLRSREGDNGLDDLAAFPARLEEVSFLLETRKAREERHTWLPPLRPTARQGTHG